MAYNNYFDSVKELNNKKEFEKNKENERTVTKLSILSLVYGSTLSSSDILELRDMLGIIADYKADKEKRL